MTVFISYRHSDREKAAQINSRLIAAGINTYMDVLDPESQTTQNITEVITKNIARASHLIAVISKQTAQSWWVPFEIGEATISATRIASFRTGYSELPEFLQMWPQMTRHYHLDMFIDEYKKEQRQAVYNRGMFESAGSTGTKSASDFHRSLKGRINQGF